MNQVLLLDGATGTHLMAAGLQPGECPEKWLLASPEHQKVLIDLQVSYMKAGSDILYTPTFGANRVVLSRYGLGDQVISINQALAALSVRAREEAGRKDVKIAGDMSSTGLFLRPAGDTSQGEMEDIFEEQTIGLEPSVDLYILETQLSLAEARAAVLGIRKVSSKPIFVTMTVDAHHKTMAGNPLPVCMLSLASLGIEGFGINCSQGPEAFGSMLDELTRIRPHGMKLVCKPNAGMPTEKGFSMLPDEFATKVSQLPLRGADCIGGCCGTSPPYIEAVKAMTNAVLPDRDDVNIDGFACDERLIYDLDGYQIAEEKIAADSKLDNALFDLPPKIIPRIWIETEEQLDNLVEELPLLEVPVMLGAENEKLLSKAVHIYPGRALIDPDCVCPKWYHPAKK
ncbi:MAG TPA: hypothetical protein DCY74_08535 [Clostridiales bacterium]|jgi:5-methyltetrahydrofolate--homocysteine methyltransferase|nr:hypothetical protein [Clostridiales bacterium]